MSIITHPSNEISELLEEHKNKLFGALTAQNVVEFNKILEDDLSSVQNKACADD